MVKFELSEKWTDQVPAEIRDRLKKEPKIRAEMFAVYDSRWRSSLADEGLIPYRHCASREYVCVWCDLVVGEFRNERDMSNFVQYHRRMGCEKPEQEETPDEDETLCRMREENASDNANAELTTNQKIDRVGELRDWKNLYRNPERCSCLLHSQSRDGLRSERRPASHGETWPRAQRHRRNRAGREGPAEGGA